MSNYTSYDRVPTHSHFLAASRLVRLHTSLYRSLTQVKLFLQVIARSSQTETLILKLSVTDPPKILTFLLAS